jgi:hypothetical protein
MLLASCVVVGELCGSGHAWGVFGCSLASDNGVGADVMKLSLRIKLATEVTQRMDSPSLKRH